MAAVIILLVVVLEILDLSIKFKAGITLSILLQDTFQKYLLLVYINSP